MHIIWHGQSCFQIIDSLQKGEQVSVVIDPFDESTGLKPPSLSADILLFTHNNKKALKGEPFIIEGPGEYERKGIFIQGIVSSPSNTIYVLEIGDIRICHLGNFDQKELTADQLDKIEDIDVLMIPVGGGDALDAKGAAKLISQIEPRMAIPMSYYLPKLKLKLDGVDKFLKEIGKKSVESQEKLLIKKKDLPLEETKIVVLQP